MTPTADQPKGTPAIEMIEVTVGKSRVPESSIAVLEKVNWSVRPEDYWVVAALPGTGKTDLLTTAAGLHRPLDGQHYLFGNDLSTMHGDEALEHRMQVAFVFEDGGRLFTHLTVAENLSLPLCYHQNCHIGGTQEKVREILKLTDLQMYAKKVPGEIPRNLHGRIALARALCMDPKVLVLDNPLGGLDPRQMHWMVDFLSKLNEGQITSGKMTLIISTDDLRLWADRGKQFALIQQKQLINLGGLENLKKSNEPLIHDLLMADYTHEG